MRASFFLMSTYRKIVAHKLSVNIRDATEIVTSSLPEILGRSEVLVKNKFVGINASDINFTAGIYQPDVKVPFDCGFEALGEVISTGGAVTDLKPGDPVITQSFGSFAEFQTVPRRKAFKAPSLEKEWLPLALSGVTASIALEEVVRPIKGERAVVTAAAGGTGQFACQLLNSVYQCNVVGTCSNAVKAQFIEEKLGCEAAVNSSVQNIGSILLKAYPLGANVVYESVGGDTLDQVVDNLALRGRVVSIGSISCYKDNSVENGGRKPLPLRLLAKSATLHSFFLPHYTKFIPRHLEKLFKLVDAGKVKSFVDPTPFRGLSAVYDAVDFMYSRKNCGKVVVQLH